LYLKDESVHPTASLKHRLARSRFLYARCNGWIGSGSAVIEAYFARLIGLPFVAVMPASTSAEKIALIEFYGGRCHLVEDAGAGGTSATIGRFVRYRRYATRIAVADPENPAFYEGWESDRSDVTTKVPSRIEGIGRKRGPILWRRVRRLRGRVALGRNAGPVASQTVPLPGGDHVARRHGAGHRIRVPGARVLPRVK